MKISAIAMAFFVLSAPAWAQTPDGAAVEPPDGSKPTPQKVDKDGGDQDSVRKAPDQTQQPATTTPPTPSADTKPAAPPDGK